MGRPDRTRTSGPYRRVADFRASTTDPDASPLRPTGGGARLGYHDHYVVDGGKARIILTALVTPAEVQDNQPALDLLWRTRFRWKLHPRQVTGDSKYGTVENIVAIEDQRIRAYVPLSEAGQPPRSVRGHGLRLRPPGRHLPLSGERDAALHLPVRADTPADLRSTAARRAMRAPSARSAPPRREGGGSGAASTRNTWTGCAATTRPSPTPRRCASGRSGWNRSSPRPRTGTGCAASGCAGWNKVNIEALRDRRGPESEALAQQTGLGTPPMAGRGGRRGAPGGAASVVGPR